MWVKSFYLNSHTLEFRSQEGYCGTSRLASAKKELLARCFKLNHHKLIIKKAYKMLSER